MELIMVYYLLCLTVACSWTREIIRKNGFWEIVSDVAGYRIDTRGFSRLICD